VTKQNYTTKLLYIANAVFRIVQNHSEYGTLVGFRRDDRLSRFPLDPPLTPYKETARHVFL